MSGGPGLSLINFVIAFAIDLGLLVLLLPRWGIVGAGVAWATAIATRNLITFIQIKHLYGIHPICPPMIKACVANLVSFAAIPLLVRWATGNTWLTVAAIAIGTGLYAVFLYRGGTNCSWKCSPNHCAGSGVRNGTPPRRTTRRCRLPLPSRSRSDWSQTAGRPGRRPARPASCTGLAGGLQLFGSDSHTTGRRRRRPRAPRPSGCGVSEQLVPNCGVLFGASSAPQPGRRPPRLSWPRGPDRA